MTRTLAWPLTRAARLKAEKPAVRDDDRVVTYAELHRRVLALGDGLDRLGVSEGARIAFLGDNSLAHFEAWFGVPIAGRVIADLNLRLAIDELAFIVDDAQAELLVVDDGRVDAGRALIDRCASLRHLVIDGEAAPEFPRYESLVIGEPGQERELPPGGTAAISYTGGTTGRPKGVILTHENLLANALHNITVTHHAPSDRFLHVCPMFHVAGVSHIFAATWMAAEHVLLPRFEAAAVAQAIEREEITFVLLVPTMIAALLDHLEHSPADLSTLRALQYAASPISPELQRRLVSSVGVDILQAYGMTEAAPSVTLLDAETHARGIAGEEPYQRRLGSVGIPIPGVQAEVRDPDGRLAAPGEIGEIWVQGPNVTPGYWNQPEVSAAALVEGWYRSGDAAYADSDGYLYVVDRLKDMIISGGENVYSIEVEGALAEHREVVEAAVFGVPDSKWGEAVHATVVVRPDATIDEEELIAHCRERIAGYKVPRSVELRTTALPKSGAGKILKRQLRDPFWAGLARNVA